MKKVHVNHQSRDGSTALKLAAFNGRVSTVCELLKNKEVDPNLVNVLMASLEWSRWRCCRVVATQKGECESTR
jgi:ankyrin repeat protein